MKVKNVFLLVILACLATISCKSSSTNVGGKKKVNIFTKIASSAGIDIVFVQGNSHTYEIETDAENLDKIEVTEKKGALEFSRKEGTHFKRNSKITVHITAQSLEAIAMSGGADFCTKRLERKEKVSIAASGGADIEIDELNTTECDIALSGGADCKIARLGAQTLRFAASGGSDASIYLTGLESVNVAVSGGADISLSGKTKIISASCSGGADLDISKLSYETISSNKSGGGSIKK